LLEGFSDPSQIALAHVVPDAMGGNLQHYPAIDAIAKLGINIIGIS
jgi:hypothetical protein